MRHILTAAALAAGLFVGTDAARALPLAPVVGAAAAPEITLVADGCGPGGHRGYSGRCRPNHDEFRPRRGDGYGYGYGYGFHHGFGRGPDRDYGRGPYRDRFHGPYHRRDDY